MRTPDLRNLFQMVNYTNDGDPGKTGLLHAVIASIVSVSSFFFQFAFDWHLRLQSLFSIDLTYVERSCRIQRMRNLRPVSNHRHLI